MANAVNAVNAANHGEATRFPFFGQMSIFDHTTDIWKVYELRLAHFFSMEW